MLLQGQVFFFHAGSFFDLSLWARQIQPTHSGRLPTEVHVCHHIEVGASRVRSNAVIDAANEIVGIQSDFVSFVDEVAPIWPQHKPINRVPDFRFALTTNQCDNRKAEREK